MTDNDNRALAWDGVINDKPTYSSNVDVFAVARDSLRIADVISHYYPHTARHGNIPCPFGHTDRTPSFHIYEKTNSFYCFSCGVGGDIVGFVSQYFNLTPIESVRKLNDDFCLDLPLNGKRLSKREIQQARAERERCNRQSRALTAVWDEFQMIVLAFREEKPPEYFTAEEKIAYYNYQSICEHWKGCIYLEELTRDNLLGIVGAETVAKIKLLADKVYYPVGDPMRQGINQAFNGQTPILIEEIENAFKPTQKKPYAANIRRDERSC